MKFKLIAEIGVNHLGSLKLAKEIIDAGISVGIELFKFQIYTMNEIGEDKTWQWYNYMSHCSLSKEQHLSLKEYCEKKNVTYFASVFGEGSLETAKEMDMKLYKLASRSVYDKDGNISELARKVYATDEPVISSLGWRQEFWPFPDKPNNTNLYCVSKYPTTRKDIRWPDFNKRLTIIIAENGERYSQEILSSGSGEFTVTDPNTFETKKINGVAHMLRPVSGFSDHSIGTELAKEAIDLGATIIEKYFTIDKTLYGPDQKGSSLPSEMKEIMDYGNHHFNDRP